MHRFKRKGKILFCENASIQRLASVYETPFYLYSQGTFLDHFMKLKRAFRRIDPLICYSMKSNSNLAICRQSALNSALVARDLWQVRRELGTQCHSLLLRTLAQDGHGLFDDLS